MATEGYSAPGVGATITRARALAEQLDRSDDVVPLLYGQWLFHAVRSELSPALSFAERMEQVGEAQDDVGLSLLGHLAHGITRLDLGDFVAARALFERCHGLDDPDHRAVYAEIAMADPHGQMLRFLALTLTCLGYVDQGRARLNEALRDARQRGHVYTLAFVLSFAAWTESATRLPHEALLHANEAVALSTEQSFPILVAHGIVFRGWVLTALGQAQEGLALITQGLSMYRAAELKRLEGVALSGLNRLEEAQNALAEALHIAQKQQARALELRAAMSMARLWRDQGKRAEARDLLTSVYGWFTEGFDTLDLKEAKKLLDELAT
jgi:predicted ATPase